MDILSHGLWTNAVYYPKFRQAKVQRYVAVLFGLLPDFVSFVPAMVYLFFTQVEFSPGLFESGHWVFRYASQSYNYTHSLIVFVIVVAIVTVFRRGRVYWPLAGWGFHILLDIPTHKDFFPTPFLFPLSDYRFVNGVNWGHPVFLLVNYSLLIVVYAVWFFYLQKKHEQKIS